MPEKTGYSNTGRKFVFAVLIGEVGPYRWEFMEDGVAFDVAVRPRITTNDMLLMLRSALAGGGITFAMEETFRPYLERGELVPYGA